MSVLCALVLSCSLDYTGAYLVDEMSEEIPDSVLISFTHTAVRAGVPAFQLSAGRAAVYESRQETIMEDVRFREFDRNGEIATEGRAGEAVIFTDTENAEISGDIEFYSHAEEATFTTEYLFWDNERKRLTSREEYPVTIKEDSGSEIQGSGFEANVRKKEVTFSGPVSGRFVAEEEDGAEAGRR